MKCSICASKIENTFMNKIVGTIYTKDKKQYPVCKSCQSKMKNEDIKEKLEI